MFKKLTYSRFKELADSNTKIAVYKEIPGDQLTPISAYLALQDAASDITLLESNPKEKHLGKFSHLCFNPSVLIKSFADEVQITQEGKTQKITTKDPFAILREYQKKHIAKVDHPNSGFCGGMVGFISYDAIRLFEDIPNSNNDDDNIPDTFFRFYNDNITFNHQTGKIIISTLVEVKTDTKSCYEQAFTKIDNLISILLNSKENAKFLMSGEAKQCYATKTDIDDADYVDIVGKAKQHIINGDAFQIVLSRKFSLQTLAKPFDIYRALRFSSPSPYMFYIEDDDFAFAGASPEKLVHIRDNAVEACPLAGTRPRNVLTDEKMASELLGDAKEVAEHMMLVDLTRNDLGSICVPGSVKVVKLKEIEKFARVMHISSTVQGVLREGMDAFDAIRAAFPAGTLSGAPKIRAMTIIDGLENSRRGLYGGAICAIDSEGNLDSCIAIRMAMIKDGVATVRAGAGVVYDSDPQKEADETRHKARAILEGITLAGGEDA